MPQILILQNDHGVPPGHLAAACDRTGVDYRMVRLWDGEEIPATGDWSGVVSLGGHMGAYDEDAYPYLIQEKAFLRDSVAAGVPTLGLCLGSQLLADALGGRAFLAERPEVDFVPALLTDAGREDPVVKHLDLPVLVFHRDTWELPPDATLLAESALYPQAFRLGSGLGIQPHPETTPQILDMWLGNPASRRLAADAGTDPDLLADRYRAAYDPTSVMAHGFFTAWLADTRAGAGAAAS